MGFIQVDGMEKLLKARDNLPKNRLEKWQEAVTALPLLARLKEMEKLGIRRGLVYSYAEHVSAILTPLCERSEAGYVPFSGFHFVEVLAFMHSDGSARDIRIRGPEADAFDSTAPSLKTKISLNSLPGQLNYISPEDQSVELLRSFRAHALLWREEMLANLSSYMGENHLSASYIFKGDIPDPVPTPIPE